MSYIVRSGDFEGPFDLLLHLIARQKVDLWQVSLSAITEDYLAEVQRMHALDLEVATEFLVVAATLIELKAARLLPGGDGDRDVEALLEERDLLFARLLQYQAYKQVGGLLAERLAAAGRAHPRTVGPDEQLNVAVPNLLDGWTPDAVARLAARALTPAAVPPPPSQGEHIAPPRLSLAETVSQLHDHLEQVRETTFARLVGPGALPVETVVHFLAVLELYKRSLVDVEQAAAFAPIHLRWAGHHAPPPAPRPDDTDARPEAPDAADSPPPAPDPPDDRPGGQAAA